MELNAKRCMGKYEGQTVWPEIDPGDEARNHRWAAAPVIDVGELGPIAWWKCADCPAMALHDPETEDGFQAEIVVVYPPSCFEIIVCSCGGPLGFHAEGDRHCLNRCPCPAKASGDVVHLDACPEGEALAKGASRARAPEPAIIVHPPSEPPPPILEDELPW